MERNIALVACAVHTSKCFLTDLRRNCQLHEELVDEEEEQDLTICTGRYLQTHVRITLYIENTVLQYNSVQSQEHFRMSPVAFNITLGKITRLLQTEHGIGRPIISPQKQLLSVLWLLATPDSYRSVADRFDMGKSSLHHSFIRIVHILNELDPRVIKWPQSPQEIEDVVMRFQRSGLNNILSAIDGSYIPIKAPRNHPEAYICRKRFHAITLQAICSYNLMFTDCFVGYPSSVNGLRIFRNSTIYRSFLNNYEEYFPNDEFIIGDKAYPVRRWLITPYINNENLTLRQSHFNTVLSKVRQAIERAFALLKGRFRRLKFLDMNRIDFIPATILASCVLHNLCLQNGDGQVENYVLEGMVDNNQEDEGGDDTDEPNFLDEVGILRRDRIALTL